MRSVFCHWLSGCNAQETVHMRRINVRKSLEHYKPDARKLKQPAFIRISSSALSWFATNSRRKGWTKKEDEKKTCDFLVKANNFLNRIWNWVRLYAGNTKHPFVLTHKTHRIDARTPRTHTHSQRASERERGIQTSWNGIYKCYDSHAQNNDIKEIT